MASVTQRAAISFGLVHVPISLYTATRDNSISFHQLHKDTHERIHYKKVTDSGLEAKSEDIVKGYEIEKDKYIVLSDDEIESTRSEKEKNIQIIMFISREELDSIYLEKSYYAIPEAGGERAFELLRTAMLETDKIAIGKTVLRTQETLMSLMPTHNGILAETLFFADEIKPIPKAYSQASTSAEELNMAKTLIEGMVGEFDPTKYKDESQERLRNIIMKKQAKETVSEPQHEGENIINLMDQLKASVEKAAPAKKKAPRKKKAAK